MQFTAASYGLLLVGAALGKADGWRSWTSFVGRLPIPARSAVVVRVGLPVVEAVLGLTTWVRPREGLIGAAVVLAVFSLVVALLADRLKGESCNCFGAVLSASVGKRLSLRNALMSVGAGVATLGSWSTSHAPTAIDIAIVALVALLVVLASETRKFVEMSAGAGSAQG